MYLTHLPVYAPPLIYSTCTSPICQSILHIHVHVPHPFACLCPTPNLSYMYLTHLPVYAPPLIYSTCTSPICQSILHIHVHVPHPFACLCPLLIYPTCTSPICLYPTYTCTCICQGVCNTQLAIMHVDIKAFKMMHIRSKHI